MERWWKTAYKWLCHQMELRGIKLNGRCPMWAFTHKPDFRSAYYGVRGVVRLELELEAPNDQVLLSNFGAWHAVLNNHYLWLCDEDVDADIDRNEFTREQVVKSWETIFDLDACRAYYGDTVQATFPCIELDYVRRTWEFPER